MAEINLDDANIYELLINKKNKKKVSFNKNKIIIPEIIGEETKKNKISKKIIYIIILIVIIILLSCIYLFYDNLFSNTRGNYIIENISTYDTRIMVN